MRGEKEYSFFINSVEKSIISLHQIRRGLLLDKTSSEFYLGREKISPRTFARIECFHFFMEDSSTSTYKCSSLGGIPFEIEVTPISPKEVKIFISSLEKRKIEKDIKFFNFIVKKDCDRKAKDLNEKRFFQMGEYSLLPEEEKRELDKIFTNY